MNLRKIHRGDLAVLKKKLLAHLAQARDLETVLLTGDHARYQRKANRCAQFYANLWNAVEYDSVSMIRSGFVDLLQDENLLLGRASDRISILREELGQYLYSTGYMGATEIAGAKRSEQLDLFRR